MLSFAKFLNQPSKQMNGPKLYKFKRHQNTEKHCKETATFTKRASLGLDIASITFFFIATISLSQEKYTPAIYETLLGIISLWYSTELHKEYEKIIKRAKNAHKKQLKLLKTK